MANKVNRIVDSNYLSPVIPNYQGSKYVPVTNKECIETIGNYIQSKGLVVKQESYLSASMGQRMIGKLILDYPDREGGYLISYKNSGDGSMSFGISSGFGTWICSNGSIFGSHSSFKKRHTENNKELILHQIEFVVDQMEEVMQKHIFFRESLKNIELNKRQISEIAGRLYLEDDIIKSQQLAMLKHEVEKPTYEYGYPGSAWEFYNHCTLAIRDATPLDWHTQHEELSQFFVDSFDLPKFELNPVLEEVL